MKANGSNQLFVEERKEMIIALLAEKSKVTVSELCDCFGVSPVTIRGDLRDLEDEGRLKRTHGGAIPMGKASFELYSDLKELEHLDEKQRIAVRAVEFIEDGDTIALDTGTSILELAKCLTTKKNLTVVTYDLKIATFLENNSDTTIVLIGGTVRRGFHCIVGPMAVSYLTNINVDKAFIASNAFSLEKGFTTPIFDYAEVKKAMISIASQTFMLLDSSKIGRISFIKFADLSDIDKMITDSNIGKKAAQDIKDKFEYTELIIV